MPHTQIGQHLSLVLKGANLEASRPVTRSSINLRSNGQIPTESMISNDILVLVFFLLTNFIVAFPFYVPLPAKFARAFRRFLVSAHIVPMPTSPHHIRVPIDFLTAPVISVLLLLATGSISGQVVRIGIVGAEGINSADIMALFISLAYIAISLDATGLFRFLALWVATKGGSSGPRLFVLMFTLFFATGTLVGNDPVVLSGTPFLAYFTRAIDVDPTGWIFSQFVACNTASAILLSSNPTNLVLAGAFSLSFLDYTSNIIVPVLISVIFVLPVLLILFRSPRMVPSTIPPIDVEPTSALVDRHGAIFGTALLLATLGVLVGTSVLHVPVWMVTAPPALIMLLRDIVHDRAQWKNQPDRDFAMDTMTEASRNKDSESPKPPSYPIVRQLSRINCAAPTAISVIKHLPLSLLPFSFSMFILVQGLVATGWIAIFANWWQALVEKAGFIGSIAGMSTISCLLCNVCGTNIGATILLARVLQIWIKTASPSPRIQNGSIFALALGSNFGAFTLSFSASLAGFLWRSILKQKGIHVSRRQFALLNTPLVAVAMGVSSAILIAQMYIIHPE